MADTTYFLNPGGASGDWSAGNNGNTGLSKAQAWATLAYAIANHASDTPGDTITLNIIGGGSFTEQFFLFDDGGGKHNGFNFVLQLASGETGMWTDVHGSMADLFIVAGPTSGSITVKDMELGTIAVPNATCRRFFDITSGDGMDCTIEDSTIVLSGGTSRLYDRLGASSGASNDVNVNNCVISTLDVNILNADGIVTIVDSTLISTGVYSIGNSTLDIEKLTISDSSITCSTGDGLWANPGSDITIGTLILDNVTIDVLEFAIFYEDGIKDCFITNCPSLISSSLSSVVIGRELASAGLSFQRVLIDGNEISGIASGSNRGLMILHEVNNATIINNKISGASHALFSLAQEGLVENNIIIATETIGYGVFGSNTVVKNNTVYTAGGTSGITGAGGADGTTKDQPAAKNLNVYNNIFVSADSLAYNDYDESTGITGESGRGSSATLAEIATIGDTAIDAAGTFTHAGALWNTTGANQVYVGDEVIVTAPANRVGTYEVAKVVSDTILVVLGNPGALAGGNGLTYTISHADIMNDYVNYNCYWRESGSGICRIGEIGEQVISSTIPDLVASWSEAKSGYDADDPETFWNVNFGGINDVHSLMEDPLLDANYVPQNQNVINGGKPDANGNETSIGAGAVQVRIDGYRTRYS